MKRLLVLLFVSTLVFSCKKEDEPESFDFNISGIERIEVKVEERVSLKLLITCNDAAPENVFLSLEDVPEGVTYSFDRVMGMPGFEAHLDIQVSSKTSGGLHTLKLVGTSSSVVKEFPIELYLDKSISAFFTVYDGSTDNREEYESNLLDKAVIKLYKDEASFLAGIPTFKDTTKNGGKAYFYRLPVGNYLFTIEKGDISNVVQKKNVNGTMKGYIVAGIFRSKTEILYSAQPKAQVGDLKFRDLNADSRIDDADLGQYDYLSIYENQINEKVIWLGR